MFKGEVITNFEGWFIEEGEWPAERVRQSYPDECPEEWEVGTGVIVNIDKDGAMAWVCVGENAYKRAFWMNADHQEEEAD